VGKYSFVIYDGFYSGNIDGMHDAGKWSQVLDETLSFVKNERDGFNAFWNRDPVDNLFRIRRKSETDFVDRLLSDYESLKLFCVCLHSKINDLLDYIIELLSLINEIKIENMEMESMLTALTKKIVVLNKSKRVLMDVP
jgi:hypothetical protein